jgi:ketosteroid isomerase-like protein
LTTTKKFSLLSACLCWIALAAVADDGAMKVTNNLQPGDILDRLLSAIAASDLPATLDCFTSGPDVEVVGSEKGEQARGREAVESFFRRIYAKPQKYRFLLPTRALTIHRDVAWMVAEGGVTEPGDTRSKPYRLTAVFVRDVSGWRVALWSGSEPVGRQPEARLER